jgi:hypothetical protein
MLVSTMFISLQACLDCQNISKSCPHDHLVLNYGLRTKLYISSISRNYSKSESSFCIGQVWSEPDKSSLPIHQTSQAQLPDKSGALEYLNS